MAQDLIPGTPEYHAAVLDALNNPPEEEDLIQAADVPELGIWDSIKEAFTGTLGKQGLEERGISVEGAPIIPRLKGGLTTDATSRSIETMMSLGDDTEFRVDRPTGRLTYKQPGQAQFTVIDPPGMDPGDWLEIFGDVPAMTGGALGYILSKKFPGGGKLVTFMKRAMGLAGGAYVGEVAREGANIQRGAYDAYPKEDLIFDKLVVEPTQAAGLELVGAGVGRTLGGAYKSVKGYLTGKNIPGMFIEKGLQLTDRWPQAVDDINKFLAESGSDKVFKPDSARTLNDPEFMSAINRFIKERGLEGHDAIRELYEANTQALEEALEQASAGAAQIAEDVSGYEAGRSAARVVDSQTRTAESAMAARVAEQESAAASAATDVEQLATAEGTAEAFGQSQRNIAVGETKALADWADEVYSAIGKAIGDKKFFHNNLFKEVDKQHKLFSDDIAQTLTEENRRLVDDIRNNLIEMRKPPASGQFTAANSSSYLQQKRLITQLKSLERQIDRGLIPNMEKAAVARIRKAAMRDRTEELLRLDAAGGTNLAKQLKKADAIYAAKKNQVAKGIFGDLMKYTNGRPNIKDSQVFSKIFGPDKSHAAASKEFSEILDNGQYLGEFQEFRNAIFNEFVKNNSTDGLVNPKKASKWLADRRQTLQRFLNPDELELLAAATDEASLMKVLGNRQKEFVQALKSGVGGEFRDVPPSKMFDKIWRSPESLEGARRVLEKRFPREWDMFKAAAVRNIKQQFGGWDPLLERRAISFDKMNKWLDDPKFTDKVRTLFGDEYLGNLEKVRAAAAIQGRKPGTIKPDLENKFVELFRKVAFGPLSHRSFAFKSLNRFRLGLQMDNLMDMILDPTMLNEAAQAMTTSDGMQVMQVILGVGGFRVGKGGSGADESFKTNANYKALIQRVEEMPDLREKIRAALVE